MINIAHVTANESKYFPRLQNESSRTKIAPRAIGYGSMNYHLHNEAMSSVSSAINPFFLKEEIQKHKNIKKLIDISNFGKNWNGYGAQPFTQSLINSVLNLIGNLDRQPKIFPTGRKSIQLEYELTNDDYLEFEIFEDRIEVYKEVGENEKEFEISHNAKIMNRIIHDFYEYKYKS
ncbi:hypothetical protein [Aquibacillus salsiterrae]|uniref:Uncharacterized protein n=1 Tax=Aquibacillus salsiterrae TaxID=2950439 RepID=A0A9X4AHY5_9BACI|nr:hypothetical protein [Aquibacillus salsiterrae]MDC3418733.1 hypothetical protein [Aquibacillus salsiterrae]